MNCEEVQQYISSYAAESLPKRFSRRISAHIAECPECRAVLELDRMVMKLVESLQPIEPPPGLWPVPPHRIVSQRRSSSRYAVFLPHRARWAFGFSILAFGVLLLARTTLIPPQQTDPALYEYAQGHIFYSGQEMFADRPALYTTSLLADAAHRELRETP